MDARQSGQSGQHLAVWDISAGIVPSASGGVGNSRSNNFVNNRGNRTAIRYQNRNHQRESRGSIAQSIKESIETSRALLIDSGRRSLAFDERKCNKKTNSSSIKERFVQANCQFLLTPNKDYGDYAKNPDEAINWDYVEEVYVTSTEGDFCCPICLDVPKAAKITRCGHVYCWSCLLHYLELVESKDKRQCPICYERIREDQLKSVTIKKKIDYVEQSYLTLNLMRIAKGSLLALPLVDSEQPSEMQLQMFSKYLIASSAELLSIFAREKEELDHQSAEYEAEEEIEAGFVQKALGKLGERKDKFNKLEAIKKEMNIEQDESDKTLKIKTGGNDYLYFYQSEDGQHIYLHSLNVRMLKHEYGDLCNCPKTITAKIIELHGESVSEQARRRFPPIRHLPISCEYRIAELGFNDSHVSSATLREFENEIQNRARNRKRKEKTQKARDRHIEIENRKRMGLWQGPNYRMEVSEFPAFQEEQGEDPKNAPVAFPSVLNSGPASCSSSRAVSESLTSSFAKMLTTGKTSFDATQPLKQHSTASKSKEEDEENNWAHLANNITLGDFFDECIKTKHKKNRKRK